MMTMPALKRMRFWSFLLLGTLTFALTGVKEAHAAPLTYVGGAEGAATSVAFNVSLTALTGGAASAAAAGDLVIVSDGFVGTTDGDPGVGTVGYTEIADLYRSDANDANFSVNWKIMGGTPDTTVSCNGSGVTTSVSVCAVHVWRNVDQTTPLDVTSTTATGANSGVPNGPAITPVTSGAVVVTAGLGTSAAAITEVTVPTGYGNLVSANPASDPGLTARIGVASKAWVSGAEDPAAWGGFDTANVNSWGAVTLAIRPELLTTLADGTNPGNSTIAPSAAITDLDAFTLATSAGTDSVTALTVTLTGANSFDSLSEVRITSDDGATLYFAAVAPTSNTVSFSGGTPIPVSTTATTFKVRITPKTHANMPVPPGLSYTVGGTVTAFTSTNAQAGTDGASATITVDNLSPGNVAGTSGTAGDAQVALSWTNPGDADLNSIVVLRSTAAVVATPVEGTTYVVGNTIGASTVACVVTSPTATCTDTGLTNATAYHYRIFTKDNNGNYDVGVIPTGSPFTPSALACYAVASANWNVATTWASTSGGVPGTCGSAALFIPGASDPVIIGETNTAYTVTIPAGYSASALSVVIGAFTSACATAPTGSKNLTLAASTSSLAVGGNVTLCRQGGAATSALSAGAGTVTVSNLTLGGTTGGTQLTDLTISTGTVTVSGSLSPAGADGRVTFSGAGTLNIGGSFGDGATFTASTGTVAYNGSGAQSVGAYTYNNLTVSGTGTITNAGAITVSTALSGSGTLTQGTNATLTIGGTSGITGLDAATNSNTVTYSGTAAQTVKATTYHHLTVNNAAGLTINSNVTLNGTLTLTSGNITTGANTLITAASCPGSVSRTSGHIAGNLRLTVPSTNPETCTFHVGDANNYAPITVTKTGTNTGTLTGSSTAGEHADTTAGTSGIDKTKSVNRYWTLTGGTLASGTPYSATFQFCNGTGTGCGVNDVDAGATTANFIVAKKTSSIWTLPTVGTKTSTTTQATALSTFGEFAVGEPVSTTTTYSRERAWGYQREVY